ncbi:MAG: hypothetical protein IJS25_00655, partial [Bacteroidales bacterium]|nr:hypothetical protein [Bacteroidales bacterium]
MSLEVCHIVSGIDVWLMQRYNLSKSGGKNPRNLSEILPKTKIWGKKCVFFSKKLSKRQKHKGRLKKGSAGLSVLHPDTPVQRPMMR